MSDKIIHLSDDSFDTDVLKASGLVLVDFWAEWCGPCKMIAPILDEIAEEYEGRLTIAKLNIDDNQAQHQNTVSVGFLRCCCSVTAKLSPPRLVPCLRGNSKRSWMQICNRC